MRVLLAYQPGRVDRIGMASVLAEALAREGLSIDIRPADLVPDEVDYDACVVLDEPGGRNRRHQHRRGRPIRSGPVFHIAVADADPPSVDPDGIRAWAHRVARHLDTVAA